MTINYIEKGYGLHELILASGHWLAQRDGVWISSDDSIVQQIIDNYNPLLIQQEEVWKGIKAERDRRKSSGVIVGGKRFHSDADSRIQQIGLVMLGANLPENLQWKTLDGTFVTMTPQLAGQVFAATAYSDQAIFAAAEVHKSNMQMLENPLEYNYQVGWPSEV